MNNWKEITLGVVSKNILRKIKKILLVISDILIFLAFAMLIYASTIYILKSISLEISKNILEYFKVAIWPTIVLIAICMFRGNIASLIERIEEGEIPGGIKVKAKSHPLSQQEEVNFNKSALEEVKLNSEQFNIIVKEKETVIDNLKNSQQQLTDKLARAEIELDFERIYNIIFVSQIDLLAKLAVLNAVDWAYIEGHYGIVLQTYRKIFKSWNSLKYLNFLAQQDLIKIDPVNIAITQKGRVFLLYLSVMNYKKIGI